MAEVCVNQLGRTVIVSAEKYSGQTGFVSGQRKQQLQQIIKKYHKTTKSGGNNPKTKQGICEGFYINGAVHRQIKGGKNNRSYHADKGRLRADVRAGFCQLVIHITVEDKAEKKKHKSENIARLHAACLHKRP